MSNLCTFVNPGRNVWYEKVLNSFRRINIFAGFVDLNEYLSGGWPENPLLFYCNEYLHCNRAVFSNFLYKYSVESFNRPQWNGRAVVRRQATERIISPLLEPFLLIQSIPHFYIIHLERFLLTISFVIIISLHIFNSTLIICWIKFNESFINMYDTWHFISKMKKIKISPKNSSLNPYNTKNWKFKIALPSILFFFFFFLYSNGILSSWNEFEQCHISHSKFSIFDKVRYNFLAGLIINLYSLNERVERQMHCKSNLKIVVE